MALSVEEIHGAFDPALIDAVMRDRLACCVFRGVIAQDICEAISQKFEASPLCGPRGDQVPARILGAFHYMKAPEVYLREAAEAIPAIDRFFADTPNPLDSIRAELGGFLDVQGVRLRPGEHEGAPFSPCVLRAWAGDGTYKLAPHEDYSQLGFPPQRDLELSRVDPTVCGLNICLANTSTETCDGALRLWATRPTRPEREQLGIDWGGYDYPESYLAPYSYVQVPLRPGDVYGINGRYVHSVVNGPVKGFRLTLSSMVAYLGPDEAIYWS